MCVMWVWEFRYQGQTIVGSATTADPKGWTCCMSYEVQSDFRGQWSGSWFQDRLNKPKIYDSCRSNIRRLPIIKGLERGIIWFDEVSRLKKLKPLIHFYSRISFVPQTHVLKTPRLRVTYIKVGNMPKKTCSLSHAPFNHLWPQSTWHCQTPI